MAGGITAQPGTRAWYRETARKWSTQMPKDVVLEGCRVAGNQRALWDKWVNFLVVEAGKKEALTQQVARSSQYKDARNAIFQELQADDRWKTWWQVPDAVLSRQEAKTWRTAALHGIWRAASRAMRNGAKQENIRSASPASLAPVARPTQKRQKRSAPVTVSATGGAERMKKATLDDTERMKKATLDDKEVHSAVPSPTPFGEFRLNVYVAGDALTTRLFSIRASSILLDAHEPILAEREDGQLGSYSVDMEKLKNATAKNLTALGHTVDKFNMFSLSNDGPRKLGTNGLLRTELDIAVRSGADELDISVASIGVTLRDDKLRMLWNQVRGVEPEAEVPGFPSQRASHAGKIESSRPKTAQRLGPPLLDARVSSTSKARPFPPSYPSLLPQAPPALKPSQRPPQNPHKPPQLSKEPRPQIPPKPPRILPQLPPHPSKEPLQKPAQRTPQLSPPPARSTKHFEIISSDEEQSSDKEGGDEDDALEQLVFDAEDVDEQVELEEIERAYRANAALNKELKQERSRMTLKSFQRAADMFLLPYRTLITSHDIIPFSPRWGLAEGAGLMPHQWQGLAEEMVQNETWGGGGDGSGPGVGKSHPNVIQAVVRYWIARLQAMVDNSRARNDAKHLKESHSGPCPSQTEWPLPCPCSIDNWTYGYIAEPGETGKMPTGCSVVSIVPNTGGDWCKVVLDLFYRAPLLTWKLIPFRVAIEHEETFKIMKTMLGLRWQRDLETQASSPARGPQQPPIAPVSASTFDKLEVFEWARTCCTPWAGFEVDEDDDTPGDAPDWTTFQSRYDAQCAKEGLVRLPSSTLLAKIPEDATCMGASSLASSILLFVTPLTFAKRQDKNTIPTARVQAVSKRQRAFNKNLSKEPLLDIGLFVWDEAHNFTTTTSASFKAVHHAQRRHAQRTGGQMGWYWMLSGTMRESGPALIANHISHLLSTSKWAPGYDKWPYPTLQQTHDDVLQHLSFRHRKGSNDKERPYEKLISLYNNIHKATTPTARIAKLNGRPYDENIDPAFQEYTRIMANIIRTLILERDETTKRLDQNFLLKTADIEIDEKDFGIKYNEKAAQLNSQLRQRVQKELEEHEQEGITRGASARHNVLSKLKSYHALCVAGSSPGLVEFCENADINTRTESIRPMYKNPSKSLLWKNFDAITRLDQKWKYIHDYVVKLEKGHKSKSSDSEHGGGPRLNKMLLGTKMPVVALLYAIGLAKHFECSLEPVATLDGLSQSKSPVAIIHAGMSLPERRMYVDAFNTLDHPLRYLVTTAELFAEGVSLIAANHVIVESPLVRIEKYNQFKRRPIRFGQKEKVVYIRLLWNTTSPIDKRLMDKKDFSLKAKEKVEQSKDGHVKEGIGGKSGLMDEV